MASLDALASTALLLSFVFGVADTVRPLKEGPLMGADGRQYKSAPLPVDAPVEEVSTNGSPTVRVQCTGSTMMIIIKADLYNNGRQVRPEELSVGQTPHAGPAYCQASAASDAEYVIEVGLHDCGSKLTIFEDSVVYSNQLVYSPDSAGHHSITRTTSAVVPVSCHYRKTHFVSSVASQQSAPAKHSPVPSGFSLKLMTDDWRSERPSNIFYLGDALHLQASYTGPNYLSRRLFIDNCVATLEPDAASLPRYYFIENHGCLVDAKDEGSNSHFRPQNRAHVLQLHLDAFLFQQDRRTSVFITCQLTAAAAERSTPLSKACNYTHSRWTNVDGDDEACQCCEGVCQEGSPRWNSRTSIGRLISSASPSDPRLSDLTL
ncbi:zona pellucida sperm-binding protein 3-like [Lampris incognitus]|uniref:zona pellucida sperm-binding protein 3-like n=1 Tax=Lampris incognitus TaxID=2546036 RepID=UPI0024B509BA|nr:zona pellucida sperm-binding protein 3-like [Lampris incognitus]